jgi:two-component system OmpR family sensor kinase
MTVTGLLAITSIAAGVAIRAELHGYLEHRLDSQLAVAGDRNGHGPRPGGSAPADGDGDKVPPYLVAAGQSDGTLGATVSGRTVVAAGILTTTDGSTSATTVSEDVKRVLARIPADGSAHTRTLPGIGSYRLLAVAGRDQTVLVTGLPLSGVNETISRLTFVGGLIAGGLIVVAALIGGVLIRRTLRPLRRVVATAVRVSELPLAQGDVELSHRVAVSEADVRTEVGQVGAALNKLLDHVDAALTARQASETQVRQFVADASHELRTPLASIRGYAELSRRTHADVPPEVAYALERVESESKRMSVLVDDLLLLARLDAGRLLEHEEVDLTALVVDATSDAHAAGADHVWRLELPDAALSVLGDGQRLHQILANLLSNARVHTPPGTTVAVRLAASEDGRNATVVVVDDGPGIAPELLPYVFERFARGDSSRSRIAGSSGLGLAIARAVISAHGGTIEANSEPGRTEFSVTIPIGSQFGAASSFVEEPVEMGAGS